MRTPHLIWLRAGLCLMAHLAMPLQGQLAITEVMSSTSTNFDPRSDFWELTNFGTEPIDLSGCKWNDNNGGRAAADAAPFNHLAISPGESILFFESNGTTMPTAEQFRSWWGLASSVQVVPYINNGLGSGGDGVYLWGPSALTDEDLIDGVVFGAARPGSTFTYNRLTSFFDQWSTNGWEGAFKAVETDDVGSPGSTVGPVPIRIQQQAEGLTVEAGDPVTFGVQATGLPRPHFQWRFNGAIIPGATSNKFHIIAAQAGDAGTYTVLMTNGVEMLISASAVLQVKVAPFPPEIVVPPADLTVTPAQTAIFTVVIRGYELPTVQWRFNDLDLVGETNTTLRLLNVDFNSTGTYSVHVQNPLGSTNAAALLTVRRKPNLVITEIAGGHSTNSAVSGHADWWELTNFDDDAVNLRGYRFDDRPGVLDGAFVVTNDITLQPGESVLFIQDLTPEAFTSWWGEENLPEKMQFIRYTNNSIESEFDAIYLWNATALNSADLPENWLVRAEYFNLNPDATPLRGNSLTYWCDGWIEQGRTNILGQCGAVRAFEADDIGSPGYIANHPVRALVPRCLSISREAQIVHLTWKTQSGKRYELQRKNDLDAPVWAPLGQHTASGTVLSISDPEIPSPARSFYRLKVIESP